MNKVERLVSKCYDDNLFGHISGGCKDMGKYSSEEKQKA